jgi:uncharacterized membrane protein YhfC
MISVWIFAATVFAIGICFLLPLGYLVAVEKKRTNVLRPYWMGALGFFVAEFLLLLPFLNVLRSAGTWYSTLQEKHLWGYAFFLAAMTAVFENAIRFLIIKFLLKDRNRWVDAVSMGVGQGLVAGLMTGVTLVGMLFYYVSINGGVLDQVTGLTGDALAQMEAEILALKSLDLIFLGLEQFCALCMQMSYCVLMYECVKGRKWQLLPAAVVWQMIPNVLATLLTPSQGGTSYVLEGLYMVLAALSLLYIWKEKSSSLWGSMPSGKGEKPNKSMKEIMRQMPK